MTNTFTLPTVIILSYFPGRLLIPPYLSGLVGFTMFLHLLHISLYFNFVYFFVLGSPFYRLGCSPLVVESAWSLHGVSMGGV